LYSLGVNIGRGSVNADLCASDNNLLLRPDMHNFVGHRSWTRRAPQDVGSFLGHAWTFLYHNHQWFAFRKAIFQWLFAQEREQHGGHISFVLRETVLRMRDK